MIFAALFVVLLLASPGLAQANELLRIYDLARSNDAAMIAARHERDAAIQVEPRARALLLPQLGASYSEVYNDTDIDLAFTDPSSGQTVDLSRKNTGTDSILSVKLEQSLFNLESWYGLKQASEQAALAQLNYRSSEQALLLRVADSYFRMLAARDRRRTSQAETSALQRRLELARQNLKLGLGSITDVQDVQARHDVSLANALAADQALTAAQLALGQMVRAPLREIDQERERSALPPLAEPRAAALRPDIPLPLPQPAAVDQWVEFTGRDNLDLLASRLNFNIATRGVAAARSRYLPTVSASASYTDSRTDGGSFPTNITGPAVGIGVTVPLFAGGATQARVRQSLAIREQRLSEYDEVGRQVEAETRNQFDGVVTGAARVQALKQALASSVSQLAASETGLKIGTRSAVDVLNAQQQRYAAERDYEQSRYEYLLSVLRLKAAGGRLAVPDLVEVDGLLERADAATPESTDPHPATPVVTSIPASPPAPSPEGPSPPPAVSRQPPAPPSQAPAPPQVPAPLQPPPSAASTTTTQVGPAAAAARGLRAWYVQVGSYAEQDNARKTQAAVRGLGFDSESAPVRLPSGASLFRVRAGPFSAEIDARLAYEQLAHRGYPQSLVLSEPPKAP